MAGNGKKIGVLVESHFDETEYRRFNQYFPEHGYAVEYLSHLWEQRTLTFNGNDGTETVTVDIEVNDVDPADYAGIIFIGGYAMDRLRYQEHLLEAQPNRAPAVEFARKAMASQGVTIGAICHGLWLLCAAPDLLRGREVTGAHNIREDLTNAGATYMYDGAQGKDTHIEGNLVTGRHPGVVDQFMHVFVERLAELQAAAGRDGLSPP